MKPPLTFNEIVKILKIHPLKKFSQNFLLDESITDKIAKRANVKNCHVVEIGSGPGTLTRSIISEGCLELDCVEIDRRFINVLKDLKDSCPSIPIRVHKCDILKFDLCDTFSNIQRVKWDEEYLPKAKIIGNLPFNVSISVLLQFLKAVSEKKGPFQYGRIPMYLSFQKEVAVNLISDNINDTSRLTIMTQSFCEAKSCISIHRSHFTPVPKVDVIFVELIPRIKPLVEVEFDILEQIVKGCLQYPGKHIINSATLFLRNDKDLALKLLKNANIDPCRTPKSLSLDEWCQLSNSYVETMNQFGFPLIVQPMKSPPPIIHH